MISIFGSLDPALCKECGGQCCLHPHIQPREYRRIVEVLGPARCNARKPRKLSTGWFRFEKECPALSSDGCRLEYQDRPLGCRLYPFEMLKYPTGWRILLDVSLCPHAAQFVNQYDEAVKIFQEGFER